MTWWDLGPEHGVLELDWPATGAIELHWCRVAGLTLAWWVFSDSGSWLCNVRVGDA